MPCNASYSLEARSAVKNLVGQTCTHAKAGGHVFPFSYAVKDYAQNSMCATTTAPNDTADKAAIANFIYHEADAYDNASAIPTCVASPPEPTESDASILLPGAASFLALAALLA